MKLQHKHLNRALGAVLISAVALFGHGCASIVHAGNRTVSMNTVPAGAKATIRKADSGVAVHSGVTPLTVQLNPKGGFFRGQSYVVRFELQGFQASEVTIRSELSGWYWGNIVFGGLIGMLIVDPATGAMWNLSPKDVQSSLSANQASMVRDRNGFVVALISDVSAQDREKMVRIN